MWARIKRKLWISSEILQLSEMQIGQNQKSFLDIQGYTFKCGFPLSATYVHPRDLKFNSPLHRFDTQVRILKPLELLSGGTLYTLQPMAREFPSRKYYLGKQIDLVAVVKGYTNEAFDFSVLKPYNLESTR